MATVTALRTSATHSITPKPQLLIGAPTAFDSTLLLQHVAPTRRRIRSGEFVHAGLVKSTIASSDGREKVTGFQMRGALLGLEAMAAGTHVCDVVALEDGEIWEFEFARFMAACARVPALQHAFTATMAAEILAERSWMLTLGTLGAEQRVAALLLDFGTRLEALGFSASRFVLRMTRAEIGSFLGLQLETVTRAMTQLDDRGLISVQRREIDIRDADGLRALIGAPSRSH
jgi:CRP/FNR family transcriptional regulator